MLPTQPSLLCDPLYRRRLLEFRRFVLLFFSRGFTGLSRQLPAETLGLRLRLDMLLLLWRLLLRAKWN